eukprot:4499044-Amphidinium_carterae.1
MASASSEINQTEDPPPAQSQGLKNISPNSYHTCRKTISFGVCFLGTLGLGWGQILGLGTI